MKADNKRSEIKQSELLREAAFCSPRGCQGEVTEAPGADHWKKEMTRSQPINPFIDSDSEVYMQGDKQEV